MRDLLARFPSACRAELPLLDYLHVRLAEGMVAMAGEDFALAIQHFRFVQSLEGEINDAELLAISNFWTARCLRHIGRYDDALGFTVKGRRLALDSGYAPMAAIMQVLESWLAFQKGKLNEAVRLLQEAETALSATDDFVTRGNIQSAYGRIARRQGRHEAALEYFHRAIAEYQRRDPQHLHLARSLVNIAVVERLIALRQQQDIDRASARRRADSDRDNRRAHRAPGEPKSSACAPMPGPNSPRRSKSIQLTDSTAESAPCTSIRDCSTSMAAIWKAPSPMPPAHSARERSGATPSCWRARACCSARSRTPGSRSRSAKTPRTTPSSPPASPAMPSNTPGKPRTRACWRAPTSGRV